jgi:quercetin dioxygenase-like cupin family protein
MTGSSIDRRGFNRASLISLLAAAAATRVDEAAAQPRTPAAGAGRRQVLKQELPGEPARELLLIEVGYAPGAGSPAHLHANGVAAFVVSGAIASKVNDGPEQVFRAGEAWWEPPGAVHRVSRNASASEPATLLAIFVAPKGAAAADLTKPLQE